MFQIVDITFIFIFCLCHPHQASGQLFSRGGEAGWKLDEDKTNNKKSGND